MVSSFCGLFHGFGSYEKLYIAPYLIETLIFGSYLPKQSSIKFFFFLEIL